MTDLESKIQYVWPQFRVPDPIPYPQENRPDFELWFSFNINSGEIPGDFVYLPVLWTAVQKAANFGNDKEKMGELQRFVNTLDPTKKYFSICQYDDSILVDLSHLNVKVFAMAGGKKDYQLPLICQKTKNTFFGKKDLFASFVGRRTHPLRDKIFDLSPPKDKPVYISEYNHNNEEYFKILGRSVFALCPRGYSFTSFRIQEAIEMGAIPVWISNQHFGYHGFSFEKYGVIIREENIPEMYYILSSITADVIKEKMEMLPTIYESLYTFQSNKNAILNQLKKWG